MTLLAGCFWSFMVHNHLTWLDDENGKAITPGDLEKRAPDLKDLQNDAYRTWSRWVRDSCGYVKAGNDCVTGWPEAVTRLRLPQNAACRFPALRSSKREGFTAQR